MKKYFVKSKLFAPENMDSRGSRIAMPIISKIVPNTKNINTLIKLFFWSEDNKYRNFDKVDFDSLKLILWPLLFYLV